MLDFSHIFESSLVLTFGGVLLKLIDKTYKSSVCTEASPPVQTIVQDTESEKEASDGEASDVTVMLSYDHINHMAPENNYYVTQ